MDGERRVERARRSARDLQHDLRSADVGRRRAAAVRVAALPRFASAAVDEIAEDPAARSRAVALDVVALEGGYVGWAAMLEGECAELWRVPMYVERMSLSLNRWFRGHAEAAAARRAGGGYLLPYRDQFFVTDREAIGELGLDPDDPDWARIGWDWVRPLDPEARLRLAARRYEVVVARGERPPG